MLRYSVFVLCFLILFPASKALVKEYAHTFYDQVVITPLEQRSSLSEGSEIWLESVCAGGMRFDIDQGFIADGVWVEEAGKIGWSICLLIPICQWRHAGA